MIQARLRPIDLQLFAEEKREAPTQRRREQARRRGQVFRSVELSGAITLLVVFGALHFLAPAITVEVATWTRRFLSEPVRDWTMADLQAMAGSAALLWARVSLPLLALGAALALGLGLLQTGFAFSGAGLVPKFSHLSPVRGFQRIFSLRSTVEFIKSMLKLAVLTAIAFLTIRDAALSFPLLVELDPAASATTVAGWVDRLGWRTGLAFVALAAGDFFYQRWEHERNLRMTRGEVREEAKEMEGDPQIRGQRRRRQRELARQRMIQEVARAQVVVTNPDHFAVALRYDPEKEATPMVVAKGKGYLAQRIKEAARRHAVTVVEDPPLARALYRAVEVGRPIPEELYQAVAEVLAFVWRLKGYRAPATG